MVQKQERRAIRFVGGLTAYVESRPEVDTLEALEKIKKAQERTTRERWRLLGRFYDLWYETAPDHEHFSASLAPDLIELFSDATQPRAPGNMYVPLTEFVNACRVKITVFFVVNSTQPAAYLYGIVLQS